MLYLFLELFELNIPIKFNDVVYSNESVELIWYGDLNNDQLPELLFNITNERSSKQILMVSDLSNNYVVASQKEILFDICF